MNSLKQHVLAMDFLIAILLISLFFTGHFAIFVLTYLFIFVFMVLRTLFSLSDRKMKVFFIALYLTVFIAQVICLVMIAEGEQTSGIGIYLGRLLAVLFVLLPFAVAKIFTAREFSKLYMPSIQELSVVSFAELKKSKDKLEATIDTLSKSGEILSKENLSEIVNDLPRHNSFRYISNGNLTAEYFKLAEESLNDPNIYIVISNTGSPASELISLFTKRQYNHASLAFDYDLKTIISYNGGEKVYPPGLNQEMVEYFNKKEDASIIVYKLETTSEQKRKMIEKVHEINCDGSAYNLMGLIFKYSHKPNIMFCSQFVYKMLQYADLTYFEKRDGEVKPTDLVELDYHRKLDFAYEMQLNQ